MNDPFTSKVFVRAPLLFVTVIDSLSPVRVAITGEFVAPVVEYITVAVGTIVSFDPVAVIPVDTSTKPDVSTLQLKVKSPSTND